MNSYDQYTDFPPSIRKMLHGSAIIEIGIGRSNAQVYRVSQNGQHVYLKTHPVTSHFTFAHEVEILQWLQGKLPVPTVLEYGRGREQEYLVLSEIRGQNCVDAMEVLGSRKIVKLLATGLRMIHAVDISDCPFDERVEAKLERARYNVEHDLVDENDFDMERRGKVTAREILQILESTRPPEDDLVFTHGDYCLPNVIVRDGKIEGFIDMDRAGVSDRYNDLAIASRSIRDNLGKRYESLFFEYYGVKQVDREKIAYYRLMDELF